MVSPQIGRIVLGVSGGIAAYKSPDLVRRLRERGYAVRVVMTRGACEFITPLTMQAVSGQPVHRDLLDERAEAAMGHIELARWADTVLIAPATAECMAKLAGGHASDLLSTVCLASTAPLVIAPAMNQQMWSAAATQENLATLRRRGVRVLGPGAGDQACGEVGPGRMLEPSEIAEALRPRRPGDRLAGRRVLVTAGPTREAIDPVRYVSNHSSGKMGYALAAAAVELGASATLVSGPTALTCPPGVELVAVVSAAQMYDAVLARAAESDIFVAAAAVADYAPATTAARKLKKGEGELSLALIRTKDILAAVAALADPPFTVGFAAETDDMRANAGKKLVAKSLDMIAGNDVARPDIGFDSDDNSLTVLWRDGEAELAKAPKPVIAQQLLELVAERYDEKHKAQDPR